MDEPMYVNLVKYVENILIMKKMLIYFFIEQLPIRRYIKKILWHIFVNKKCTYFWIDLFS